jgi:hypothetical protein
MPIGWEITVVVLCVAVVALAIVILGLLRQINPVLERAAQGGMPMSNGPDAGEPMPHFAATGPDGAVTSEDLTGRPSVLVFLSVGCGPCEALATEMSESNPAILSPELLVITSEEGRAALSLPAGVRVWTESDRAVSDALKVSGTPLAIAIGPDGIVKRSTVANTVAQLTELTTSVTLV